MANVAYFHSQHFSCLEGIQNTIRTTCLCNYFERNEYPKRVIIGQKKIRIRSYESREKSYSDIKPTHIMLTDTGSTNVNLLYLPDSIEIASLEGLTFWCPEINQSKRPLAC